MNNDNRSVTPIRPARINANQPPPADFGINLPNGELWNTASGCPPAPKRIIENGISRQVHYTLCSCSHVWVPDIPIQSFTCSRCK